MVTRLHNLIYETLSPDRLEQLLHPFEQLDQGPYIQPGAGLSLALAAHIARRHGGKLEVMSAGEHGSIFTLWLPALPASELNAQAPVGNGESRLDSA